MVELARHHEALWNLGMRTSSGIGGGGSGGGGGDGGLVGGIGGGVGFRHQTPRFGA